MKLILGLFLIGAVTFSYGQQKTGVIKKTEKKSGTPGNESFPSVSFRRKIDTVEPNVTGKFIIEEYRLQVRGSGTNKAISAVGSALVIEELSIVGEKIDTISYKINDSEVMNTEDYLFRIFGEVPETVPEDLPPSILVHRTDNLDCYGIAELPDGTVLIPYKGLLLYLRRY